MKSNKNRHAFVSLLVCVMCVAFLCGCSTYVPLSERAIVKAIFLDKTSRGVQASLVVYTCKASANTADVTGTPRIYQGEGDTIEKALNDAEKQQNKKPFYAQNRLLLLGENTFDNVSSYLSYFGAEEVSRANLCVFLTRTRQDEFVQLAESVTVVVEETERLTTEGRGSGNKTRAIHELRYDENEQFCGYLPVLEIGENDFSSVDELLLYDRGAPVRVLREVSMQLALLLAGKANTLTVALPGQEGIYVKTQRVAVEREAASDGTLLVRICGKAESVTQNGQMIQGEAQQQALLRCNSLLKFSAQQLLEVALQQGTDVFSCNWWMQNEQNRDCSAVVAESRIRVA